MGTAPLLPIKSELEDSFKNPVSPYYCGIDAGRSLDGLLVYPKSPGYSYDSDSSIRTQERDSARAGTFAVRTLGTYTN